MGDLQEISAAMNSGLGSEVKYRLLLVEDDAVIAGEMKLHLEKWGCSMTLFRKPGCG